jgi:hypothetical protein
MRCPLTFRARAETLSDDLGGVVDVLYDVLGRGFCIVGESVLG